MKKRMLAVLLCTCMVVSLLPAAAFAEEEDKTAVSEMAELPEEKTEISIEEPLAEPADETQGEAAAEPAEATEESKEELLSEPQFVIETMAARAGEVSLDISTGNLTCSDTDVLYRISGESNSNHVTIQGGRETKSLQVDLSGVTIDHRQKKAEDCIAAPITVKAGSYVTLYIGKDNPSIKNFLYGGKNSQGGYAGLAIEENAHVTVKGFGSLTTQGGGDERGGAGLGGNYGKDFNGLVLNGYMKIKATGGYGAPGIGSGQGASLSILTIKNGNIEAQGGEYAPGIGAGLGGKADSISIEGGMITAKGGEQAAGIGAGFGGNVGSISINGGDITAIGGEQAAGIGSTGGTCENITISGGAVDAAGGENGAGIGSGFGGHLLKCSISNGIIHAAGGRNAAGIGTGDPGESGAGSASGELSISGGNIEALGGENGAGIGSGNGSSFSNIKIEPKRALEIQATGGAGGAGIGGGRNGSVETITFGPITNGDLNGHVQATGGVGGAGIGGGYGTGVLQNLTINGGYVEAGAGGREACDIGHGDPGDAEPLTRDGTFIVTGGTVIAEHWSDQASVQIDGGSVSANLKNVKNKSGTEVYRTTLTLEKEAGVRIGGLETKESGYGISDIYTDPNKKIYLYLPQSAQMEAWADVAVSGNTRHYYGTTLTDGNGVLKMDRSLSFKEPTESVSVGSDFIMNLEDGMLSGCEYEFRASGAAEISEVLQSVSPGAAVKLHANRLGSYSVSLQEKGLGEDPVYWGYKGEYNGTVTKMQGMVSIVVNPSRMYDGNPIEDPEVEKNSDGAVTYTYYAGSDTQGAPLAGPPVNAGTYTAVAALEQSAHYSGAESEPYLFTIEKREIKMELSVCAGGTNGMVKASVLGMQEACGSVKFTLENEEDSSREETIPITGTDGNCSAELELPQGSETEYRVAAEYIAGTPDNYICINSPQKELENKKEFREMKVSEMESKTYGDEAFKLNAWTEKSLLTDRFTYEVVYDEFPDLPDAVEVDERGTVKIKNAGLAIIKITLSDNTGKYYDAVSYVKIPVLRAQLHAASYAELNGQKVGQIQYGKLNSLKYGIAYTAEEFKNGDTAENFNQDLGTLVPVPLVEMLDVSDTPYKIGIAKEGADYEIGHTLYQDVFTSRNYDIVMEKGEIRVIPAQITVRAEDAQGKRNAEPEYAYQVDGLAPWDTEETVFEALPQVGLDLSETQGLTYAQLVPGTYPAAVSVTQGTLKKNAVGKDNYSAAAYPGNLQIDKEKAALELTADSKTYDGKPIEVSVSAADGYDGRISISYYIVKEGTGDQEQILELSESAPVNAGTYYIEGCASETVYYETEKIGKYVVVSKATTNPETPVLPDLLMRSGLCLRDLILPDGWEWVSPEKELHVGVNTESAKYTPDDPENYEEVRCNLTFNVMEYVFTAGDGGVYTKGSGKNLVFTVNGPKDECTGIKIDGTLIDAKNYTLVSGSTIITLKNAYLETLSVGKHAIAAVYGNSEAVASFKVVAASQGESNDSTKPTDTTKPTNPAKPGQTISPQTGDNSNMLLWIVLMLASCGGIGAVYFSRKKRGNAK